jgi:hypothetical protein
MAVKRVGRARQAPGRPTTAAIGCWGGCWYGGCWGGCWPGLQSDPRVIQAVINAMGTRSGAPPELARLFEAAGEASRGQRGR